MPRELSTITLSPKIQARHGWPGGAGGRRTDAVLVAPAVVAAATCPEVAGGGPTVPATMTMALAATPTAATLTVGRRRRWAQAVQSARLRGRSTR